MRSFFSRPPTAFQFFYIGVCFLFLSLYYGVFVGFRYLSAPGGDLFNHFNHIQILQQGGLAEIAHGYPKLFHAVVLAGMKLTGWPAPTVMLYYVPLLLLASALAISWVGYLLGGRWVGLLSLLLMLFVSAQPTQTLYDGGFPNVIASTVWLPLFIASLYLFVTTKKISWAGAALLLLVLQLFTHHFTLTYYLPVIVVGVICLGRRLSWKYWVGFIIVLAVLMISPLSQAAKDQVLSVAQFGGSFPWVHFIGHLDNKNAIWRLADYPIGINFFMVYIGAAGSLFLAYLIIRRDQKAPLAAMVLVWLVFLFILSRIPALGFPVRLARDMAAPLAITAALAWVSIWQSAHKLKLLFQIGAQAALVVVLVFYTWQHAYDRIDRLLNYEEAMQYSYADQWAVNIIGSHPAIAIDSLVYYSFKQDINSFFFDPRSEEFLDREGHPTEGVKDRFKGRNYAIYHVRPGSPDERIYQKLLIDLNYHEIGRFHDPLKTVVLFKKDE